MSMMQPDWHSADIISGAEKAGNIAVRRFPQLRVGVRHAGKRTDKALAQR